MTEFELAILKNQLADRLVAITDAAGTHISIYLTIISAYLVASYLVASKLTRLQASIATSVYVVAYTFEAFILVAYNRTLARLSNSLRELDLSM